MKNNAYWQKRFEELEKALNRYGMKAYAMIQPEFDKAAREINLEIEKWLNRIAKNNEISMTAARKLLDKDQLAEFKWTVEEYIKYGQLNAMNQQWMKQLENASAKYHISKLEALKLQTQQAAEVAFGNYLDGVDSMASQFYSESYYRSAFELQKGFGVGWTFDSIDGNKLSKLIAKPWAADGKNFSDRIWTAKSQIINDLHSELTRTCILGKAPDKAIERMSKFVNKKFKNAKTQAGRLVMTEQAFFSAAALKDCFNDLGVEEFEIVATLDSHTSAICQDLDGKHFPMSQYEPGVTAPPFHVWCRSTTCPYFDDEFSIGGRAARDADGKTYYVSSNMTYPEWKEQFTGGRHEDALKNSEKGAIMRYIGGESYVINDKLRRGDKLTHDELLWVETLDVALKNMPVYNGLVCRSVAIDGNELKDFLKSYQTGKIIQYNAFTSATKFRNMKDCYNPEAKVQIFIHSNGGRDISSLNPGENEVLYTIRSKFRIKAIEEKGNLYYILLEEI